MCKENDTRYVYISEDYENIKPDNKSEVVFDKIYREFFDLFCITEKFLEYMNEDRRITLMEAKAYIRNDRTLLTIASIRRKELDKKQKELKEYTYAEVIAIVEQEMGQILDEKKISAKKFHDHVKLIKERNDKKQKLNGKQDKG